MEHYLPYILIFIGVSIIILLACIALRASKSTRWEKTTGILLKKGTQLIISRDIQDGAVDWKSTHIDVEYEYEVDGKSYISTRATFSDMVNKPTSALHKLLNEYLSKNNITVYYNQGNRIKVIVKTSY